MNKHALTGTQPAQVVQGIVRREKSHRNGCRLLETEMRRLWRHETSSSRRICAKARRYKRDDCVPELKALYTFSQSRNLAGTLNPQRYRSIRETGIYAQRYHHISKIE